MQTLQHCNSNVSATQFILDVKTLRDPLPPPTNATQISFENYNTDGFFRNELKQLVYANESFNVPHDSG